MSEIAVLSDLIETSNEEEEVLFLTLTTKVRIWYVKVKFPDGSSKHYRYEKKKAASSASLQSSAIDRRREIIQERVNELALQGFKVGQKYVSLFMSKKIKELILTKDRKSTKQKNIDHSDGVTDNYSQALTEKSGSSFSDIFKNFSSKT